MSALATLLQAAQAYQELHAKMAETRKDWPRPYAAGAISARKRVRAKQSEIRQTQRAQRRVIIDAAIDPALEHELKELREAVAWLEQSASWHAPSAVRLARIRALVEPC